MSKKVEILFSMMKDGSKVPVSKMLKTLNVKQGSVMCLISALRNDFGANIETERDGRKVLSYQLMNADKVKITSKTKAPKVQKVATVAKTKTLEKKAAVVKDEVPTIDVEEITSDAELASLKAQLGLGESYSE